MLKLFVIITLFAKFYCEERVLANKTQLDNSNCSTIVVTDAKNDILVLRLNNGDDFVF